MPTIESPVIPDRIPADLSRFLRRNDSEAWHVVLWNDDHNTMDHVVAALVEVLDDVDVPGAIRLMMTAHQKGSAYVAKGPRDDAERFRDGLEDFGLTATLELAEV